MGIVLQNTVFQSRILAEYQLFGCVSELEYQEASHWHHKPQSVFSWSILEQSTFEKEVVSQRKHLIVLTVHKGQISVNYLAVRQELAFQQKQHLQPFMKRFIVHQVLLLNGDVYLMSAPIFRFLKTCIATMITITLTHTYPFFKCTFII